MFSPLHLLSLIFVCSSSVRVSSAGDPWKYIGCFDDEYPRDLTSDRKYESSKMTLEKCYNFCSEHKTLYMGLQSSDECRCDNGYGKYGKAKAGACDEGCARDSSQNCGGGWVNAVYQIRDDANTWEYIGCYADTRPRDMTSAHKLTAHDMTLGQCYIFCSQYNVMYMGLQDGDECRCDNDFGRYGKASESTCDEKCPWQPEQVCGGGWSNAIYKIKKSSLTVNEAMMKLKSTDSLVFSALGDWGKPGSGQRAVAKALGNWSDKKKSDFTMALGDNFYELGVFSADDEKFKTVWQNVYTHKSLDHPWLVIEGNHDYWMSNAPHQVEYASRGTDKRWVMPSLYYSMHYQAGAQDVHFIFLDTDPLHDDDDLHQVEWFRKEISESKADWIIVIGHHPVYSSGGHGKKSSTDEMYDYIRSEMVKHKAALYICGHDHMLEHIIEPGTPVDYIISGSGAKVSSSDSRGKENIADRGAKSVFRRSVYGFVGLELKGQRIDVTYVDRDGKEIYKFSKWNPRAASLDVVG